MLTIKRMFNEILALLFMSFMVMTVVIMFLVRF